MKDMNENLWGFLLFLLVVGGIGGGVGLLATHHNIGWFPLIAGFLALFYLLGA